MPHTQSRADLLGKADQARYAASLVKDRATILELTAIAEMWERLAAAAQIFQPNAQTPDQGEKTAGETRRDPA